MAPIGDELSFAYGNSLPSHVRQPGKIPVFGSNGQVGWHSEAGITGPGIIVGRKGSVGEVKYSASDYWPIDTTYYVVNPKAHNWRYLFYLLKHVDLTGLNSHSAVPGLNREDAYAIQAWFPGAETQEKIANALDGMTSCLALEEHAIISAQRIKQATMHELFARGLRGEVQKETEIGLAPESWEVVQLGSLGKIGNGSTPKKTVPEYWIGGTYPWLTSAKVYDREITSADQFVTDTALAKCHLPRVKPGAVLMAITGQGKTLGHCAVLTIESSVSQHVAYLQTDTSRANPSFVRGYLETQYEYLRQVASGGGSTKGALTCAFLKSLPIPLPELVEQREIVTILDAIDRKIALHQQKESVLDELFRSLLHKLMTGEISFEDLDLSALTPEEPQPKTEAEVQS